MSEPVAAIGQTRRYPVGKKMHNERFDGERWVLTHVEPYSGDDLPDEYKPGAYLTYLELNEIAALQSELNAWHTKCDEVGVPHDPERLVEMARWRGDEAYAALDVWIAAANEGMAERDAARAEAERLRAEAHELEAGLTLTRAEVAHWQAEAAEWEQRCGNQILVSVDAVQERERLRALAVRLRDCLELDPIAEQVDVLLADPEVQAL